MRNALLSLAVLVIAALSVSAQPTSITLLTPGANPGETYRAGVGYDITYKSDSTTYRSRFCFQFATSPNGPWTTMLGASNILDSTVSSQIRRGQFIGGFRAPAVVTSTGYIRMVLLNSDLTLNLNVTSICKNPITITQPPVTKVDSLLSGSITGNLTLSIISPATMGMEHHVNRNAIALHVEDIESARATLEERGVAFMGDTFDTGVCHMAFFADPDGLPIELYEEEP